MSDPFEKEVEKRALRSKQRFNQLKEQMHSLESSHGAQEENFNSIAHSLRLDAPSSFHLRQRSCNDLR